IIHEFLFQSANIFFHFLYPPKIRYLPFYHKCCKNAFKMMHKMEIVITEKKTDTKKAVGEKKSRFIPERLFKIIQLLLSEEYFLFSYKHLQEASFPPECELALCLLSCGLTALPPASSGAACRGDRLLETDLWSFPFLLQKPDHGAETAD